MLKVPGQQRLWLPSPPSVNELFRTAGFGADTKRHGRIRTEAYAQWHRQASQELQTQRPRAATGKVSLAFFFGERSPLADCSNYIKAPEDLLVEMGVIEGDNRKTVEGVSACWVPSYHGMVVHVTPWRPSEPLWAGFDDGVLGQTVASDPMKMVLHPSALGRMNRLAGTKPKPAKPPVESAALRRAKATILQYRSATNLQLCEIARISPGTLMKAKDALIASGELKSNPEAT